MACPRVLMSRLKTILWLPLVASIKKWLVTRPLQLEPFVPQNPTRVRAFAMWMNLSDVKQVKQVKNNETNTQRVFKTSSSTHSQKSQWYPRLSPFSGFSFQSSHLCPNY